MGSTGIVVPPQDAPSVIVEERSPSGNCLAVTQLVIGIVTLVLGIAARASLSTPHTVAVNAGVGIWAGVWIAMTGLCGVNYNRYTTHRLSGIYMVLTILSVFVSIGAGAFFVTAVIYYTVTSCYYRVFIVVVRGVDCNHDSLGKGLHIPLLILMIVEFFVSIIASCGSCGTGQRGGAILQQPQPQISVITSYPGGNVQYPGQMAPQYGGQVPPQYNCYVPLLQDGQVDKTKPEYPMESNVSN